MAKENYIQHRLMIRVIGFPKKRSKVIEMLIREIRVPVIVDIVTIYFALVLELTYPVSQILFRFFVFINHLTWQRDTPI